MPKNGIRLYLFGSIDKIKMSYGHIELIFMEIIKILNQYKMKK